jgi:antibiotic biosynthesis monooxygenase (ABM) superfamily enzyme
MWLLLVCGVYPTITAIEIVAGPVLAPLPVFAQFAIVVPVMVAVMIWAIIPLIHRRFGRWLNK